jgi:ribosome modulation factor
MPEAYNNGWRAFVNGASFEECPYDTRTQAASRDLWEDGWLRAFSTNKHGETPA